MGLSGDIWKRLRIQGRQLSIMGLGDSSLFDLSGKPNQSAFSSTRYPTSKCEPKLTQQVVFFLVLLGHLLL